MPEKTQKGTKGTVPGGLTNFLGGGMLFPEQWKGGSLELQK
jgi:hypothetical protein